MIRLVFFTCILLVAVYTVLVAFGEDDGRVANPVTQSGDGPNFSITSLLPESRTAEQEPAAVVVPKAEQTPERAQKFPGPELQPAPGRETSSPAPITGADGMLLYVTGERVNLRSGPSTDYQVVGALNYGTAVEALGPADAGWINIRSADGTSGYMSGQFLSNDRP